MKSLGLKPTKNSGSGWVEKEDGQNDFVICQLKSTDSQSIKVNQKDIRMLEYNASIEHKMPVFAIQFLNTGEVWLMAKPEDFSPISQYIETGKVDGIEYGIDLSSAEETGCSVKKVISNASNARKRFYQEVEKRYDKTKSAR